MRGNDLATIGENSASLHSSETFWLHVKAALQVVKPLGKHLFLPMDLGFTGTENSCLFFGDLFMCLMKYVSAFETVEY